MHRWFFSLLWLLPMAAGADPEVVTRLLRQAPNPGYFEFCHGGGCAKVQPVNLADDEWNQVRRLFAPVPLNAAQERVRVAEAIALLERLVGKKAGTGGDLGGTFSGFGWPGQLDCIDESTNTTTYLKLLQGEGLLQFHRVDSTRTRGYFLFGWPHTTATMREIDSAEIYVVDSWFYDNGLPAVILPLAEWQAGSLPWINPLTHCSNPVDQADFRGLSL